MMWLWVEQQQSRQGSEEAWDHGQDGEVGSTCTLQVVPRADTALEGRAGPWGWRQAGLGTGGGSLAQAWLTTAQVSTEPSIQPELPGCWQAKGEAPLLTALFPHSSFHSCTRGWPCARWADPGLPWVGWGSEPEAEAASRSWCSPAGCREPGSWKSRCVSLKFVAVLQKSACFRRAGTEFKNWSELSVLIGRAASFGISLQELFLNRGLFVKKTPWFPI